MEERKLYLQNFRYSTFTCWDCNLWCPQLTWLSSTTSSLRGKFIYDTHNCPAVNLIGTTDDPALNRFQLLWFHHFCWPKYLIDSFQVDDDWTWLYALKYELTKRLGWGKKYSFSPLTSDQTLNRIYPLLLVHAYFDLFMNTWTVWDAGIDKHSERSQLSVLTFCVL